MRHHDCNALIVDEDLTVSSAVVASTKLRQSDFGFNKGGTLTWNLTCVSVVQITFSWRKYKRRKTWRVGVVYFRHVHLLAMERYHRYPYAYCYVRVVRQQRYSVLAWNIHCEITRASWLIRHTQSRIIFFFLWIVGRQGIGSATLCFWLRTMQQFGWNSKSQIWEVFVMGDQYLHRKQRILHSILLELWTYQWHQC